MPYLVGLTGGIGSGKSTVARHFADLGVTTISADELAREVVAPGSAALEAIAQHFGTQVITANGELDRAALRTRIFADAQARQWLEELLHPLIAARRKQLVLEAESPYVLAEIPLLLEKQDRAGVDRVLVVDVPEELQIARTLSRDGTDAAAVRAIMTAQTSRARRLELADDIIDNSGSPDDLRVQVNQLHQCYLQLAAQAASARRT